MRLARHSVIDVTLNYYTHLRYAHLAAAIARTGPVGIEKCAQKSAQNSS